MRPCATSRSRRSTSIRSLAAPCRPSRSRLRTKSRAARMPAASTSRAPGSNSASPLASRPITWASRAALSTIIPGCFSPKTPSSTMNKVVAGVTQCGWATMPRATSTDIDTRAFPSTVTDDQLEALPMSLTWDRARGVETDDGELVAFHGSYPYQQFPVPGARTAVSGLTWVGVHPAHRRKGLLRSMIDDHFKRSLDRGEAVSALFAAEPAIYGRFGYGLAASDLRMKIPRGAALRDVPGADGLR